MSNPQDPLAAEVAALRAEVARLEREVKEQRDMLRQIWQRVFPPMAGPPDMPMAEPPAPTIEPGEPWNLRPPGGDP